MDPDQIDSLVRTATDLFNQTKDSFAQMPSPLDAFQFIQDMMHLAWDTVPAINDAFSRVNHR
jgi:hypothetical protein